MASTVGAYEAKTHLPQLLERVSKGERITITKHGVPVAMLVPTAERATPDVEKAIEAMKRFQEEQGPTLGPDLSIRDLIEEGRRF
jgi:prevent-host-death family protein